MKRIIFLLLSLTICNFLFAQSTFLQSPDNKIYSDTIATSLNKIETYNRAKEYLIKSTAFTQNIIQLDDKDSGRLIAKSITTEIEDFGDLHLILMKFVIHYTTSISVKDNKYKYVLSDVYYDTKNVTPIRANLIIKKIILELTKSMSLKSEMDF